MSQADFFILSVVPSSWVGQIPRRREEFLSREFQGQRNLASYSPWGHRESDTVEGLTLLGAHQKGEELKGICVYLWLIHVEV